MKTIGIIVFMLVIQFIIETFMLKAYAVEKTIDRTATEKTVENLNNDNLKSTKLVPASAGAVKLEKSVKDLKNQCTAEGKKGTDLSDCIKEKAK